MSVGRSTGTTDAGRKRRHNEDAFVCEPPLFAVADGMGGAQAGELASKLAANALREGVQGDVVTLIQEANRQVYERAAGDKSVSGMGTTVTGALVLLCSDGLTSMVDDDSILAIVEEHRSDLQQAAKALVGAANRGGGEDNITVVFFEIAFTLDEHKAETPAGEEPDRSDEDTI